VGVDSRCSSSKQRRTICPQQAAEKIVEQAISVYVGVIVERWAFQRRAETLRLGLNALEQE
jgi:hypothetical protein